MIIVNLETSIKFVLGKEEEEDKYCAILFFFDKRRLLKWDGGSIK